MVRRLLFFVLLACAGPAAAAELGFAHYAPGAGPVQLTVDDEAPIALVYKDYVNVTRYAAGERHLRVLAANGDLLVDGVLDLRANDRYIVIVAGNGSANAPFEVRLAADHNRVFIQGQSSLQTANLAIVEVAGFAAPPPGVFANSCENGRAQLDGYGNGTTSLDGTSAGFDLNIQQNRPPCIYSALDPAGTGTTISQVPVSAQPGDRLRTFFIGDGVNEPYEMIVVNQGREAILPTMPADGSIEGLWAIEGEPNTGLQVAFDRTAPLAEQISAVYFGFEANGLASWRTIQKLRVIEYVGGNADGTRAAVGFQRAQAYLGVHSCTDMSLTVMMQTSRPEDRMFPDEPRNTLRLKRLFPPVCPPAVPTGEEVKP